MKVLKKGRKQKGWSTEATCTGKGNGGGGCGATLLVEEPDIFRTQTSAMGEITTCATFECSECGVWTDLGTSDGVLGVPSHIVAKARQRHPGTKEPRP